MIDFLVFWTLFLAICSLIAAVSHHYFHSAWIANLLTAAIVVVGIVSVDGIRQGHFLDGWDIIAIPMEALVTFAVAACVGVFMDSRNLSRRTRRVGHGP
jgi:apolipoprotein N-acyltransferase